MKRWNPVRVEYVENPTIDKFIEEIIEVCTRHKLVIEGTGFSALQIARYDNASFEDIKAAYDCTEENPT